jgi:putative transposase
VLAALAELFIARGPPAHIRSDNVLCWEAAAGFSQQISMRRQPSARHAF